MILTLWGASCCVMYTYISQIYIPTIATDNLYFFYYVCSVHVSAPKGHPQVKHNIIYISMKNFIPQHIRYFTIIIYLSILQSYNGNSLIKWIQYI
jgi:hypothetical protein